MKITIGGLGGTGKSTIAKKLAKQLGYKHYSSGDMQRALAKERGLTITEWGSKEKEDAKYDNMVDEKTRQLGLTEDNFVIDGWLAAHFVPQAIKIFLKGDLKTRAKRITIPREAESFNDLGTAIKTTRLREMVNRKRWLEFYNYDYTDENNYDLVIDTSNLNAGQVFDKVCKYVKKKMK